jgi:hypothetical protein
VGTGKANAISFIDWGEPVWSKHQGGIPRTAQRGDVAVFRHRSNPDHGHVAFFDSISSKYEKRINVLGGNQILGKGPGKLHLIDYRPMSVAGDLELYAIRSKSGLR